MADGVDLGRFGPARNTPGLRPDGFNVLYAGRLASEAGVRLLADAFLAARQRDERLHLVLTGGRLEEFALHAQLSDRATFLGRLDRGARARVYAGADAFLSTSQAEDFPRLVLEAQASGLPVLAVDAGGGASLIDHGRTGLLVPPDVEALSTALLMLAHRPPLRTQLSRGALAAIRAGSLEPAGTGPRQAAA